MTYVVGLDLSLTATGISDGHRADTLNPPKKLGELDRLQWLMDEVVEGTSKWSYRDNVTLRPDLVVVEGLAFASHTGKASERAGLWWLVRHELWRAGVDVVVVPPTVLKKYATGKGNASKDQVLAQVVKRYELVMVEDNNAADALVLAAMGLRHLGKPIDQLPATHMAAMNTFGN